MEVKLVGQQTEWDNWLLQNDLTSSYLQSWHWGEMMERVGQKVERVQIWDNNKIVAVAQIIYKPLPFGWQYAFCPKGMVVSESRIENQESRIYETLINYLQNKKCIFFRVEPNHLSIINDSKFLIHQSIDINPRATLVLDITKTEEELLSQMHSKTRYNLKIAEKHGLKVNTEKDFNIFWKLLQKTGARDKFNLHPENSYKNVMMDNAVDQITVYDKDDKAIVAGGFVGFGDTYVYLYGALDYDARNLMGTYLMQWSAIKQAKKLGYKYYDFFGIAPRMKGVKSKEKGISEHEYDERHSYAGITRFKLGFGGEVKENPGTFDVVIGKKKYFLYKFLRWVRRKV